MIDSSRLRKRRPAPLLDTADDTIGENPFG
jgi:hypothetical protein